MINREYLNNLNEAQKEAVIHLDGPLLIVAGAGSGKTKGICLFGKFIFFKKYQIKSCHFGTCKF